MTPLPVALARRLRAVYPRAAVRRVVEAPERVVRLPFGEKWCRAILPHYFPGPPADFHGELFARLADMHTRRNSKEAVIAPRDGAKSTVITLAYVLKCALEKLEPFSLILSDAAEQACDQLEKVKREIETNQAVVRAYPDACGRGPVWRKDSLELRNGAVVKAFGTGQRVRGRKNQEVRPSLIVFDDVENIKSVASAAKRKAAWAWATREVIPAGTNGTNFLSVGSALHRECVAVRLGQLAGWRGYTYQAIHRWPDRMDLWGDWEAIATNPGDENREATADAFLRTHEAEMLAGAEGYWPSKWPVPALLKRRAEVGAAAFDSEWQGKPTGVGQTEWAAELFDWKDRWFVEWPTNAAYRLYALDPSKGAGEESDYQAHVWGMMDTAGCIWIDADLRRDSVIDMVGRAIDRAIAFQADLLEFEGNNTMGLLAPEVMRQLEERRARREPSRLRWKETTHTEEKMRRIKRGGSFLERRHPVLGPMMRFRNTPGARMLVDQLRDVPTGEFDDGPDALGTLVNRLLVETKAAEDARR